MNTRSGLTTLAWIAAVLASAPVAAQLIYKWTDANGQVHFTDTRPPDSVNGEVVGVTSETARTPPASSSAPGPDRPHRSLLPEFPPVSKERELRERQQRLDQRIAEDAKVEHAEEMERKRVEQAARNEEVKAQRQAIEDKQLIAECEASRSTYCDEGAAEIRRRRLEAEWHNYDLAREGPRTTGPPPARPSQPRPPPAETLYEKNTKKNRDKSSN